MISHRTVTLSSMRMQNFYPGINGLKKPWLTTMTPVSELQTGNGTLSREPAESAKSISGLLTGEQWRNSLGQWSRCYGFSF